MLANTIRKVKESSTTKPMEVFLYFYLDFHLNVFRFTKSSWSLINLDCSFLNHNRDMIPPQILCWRRDAERHPDNQTSITLEGLQIFWQPDVCQCLRVFRD